MTYLKLSELVITALLSISCGGGGGGSSTSTVSNAGTDQSVLRFDTVTLDGRGSENADSYEWKQLSGPYVSLDDPAQPVQLVSIPAAGTYKFRLTTRRGNSVSTDDVTVVGRERPTITLTAPKELSSVISDSTVAIKGRVSSEVVRVRIVNRTNENSSEAVLTETGVFSVDNLALQTGDNGIIVEAFDDAGLSVEKMLLITRTRTARFLDPLKLSASDVLVGRPQEVTATVSLDPESLNGKVELVALNANGDPSRVVATLQDNGDVTTGDQFRGDSEYSARFTVEATQEGVQKYRVRIAGDTTEFGNVVSLIAHDSHATEAYDVALETAQKVLQESGLDAIAPGSREFELAKDELVRELRSSPQVKRAEMAPDRHSIDVEYANGVRSSVAFEEVVSPVEKTSRSLIQTRAGSDLPEPAVPGSFKMVYFSPLFSKLCNNAIVNVGTQLGFLYLYPYEFDPLTVFFDEEATVENLKNSLQAGILDFFTHGKLAHIDGKNVATLMAEDVTPEKNEKYKEDLDTQRVITTTFAVVSTDCITGKRSLKFEKKYLITPKFFDHYIDRLPNTLVNIQACQSADDDGNLSGVFLRKGAGAVLGFTEATYDRYSSDLTRIIIDDLSNDMELGDAVRHAKEAVGENSAAWWEKTQKATWGDEKSTSQPAELRIFGGSGALAYRLKKIQVANGSFENGLAGWEPQEHGAQKVIRQWNRCRFAETGFGTYHCDVPVVPVEGEHMLMLATVGGEYSGVSQRLHIFPDTEYLVVNFALMREITESDNLPARDAPWRNQKFSIVLETEDGVDHVLDSFVGKDPRLMMIHGWWDEQKCGRISDHIYSSNSNAPYCATTISAFMRVVYDISAYKEHFVKLKILLQDDLSPVNSLSDVQDVYAFVDAVYLADKDMNPVEGH